MTVDVLGLDIVSIALYIGFGLLIGILFGFFGMGGSFLVTPALLVAGYPVPVAVGSGLAFVFGTSVIATIEHRESGQIEYTLAGVMIVGMTLGIEIGTRIVFWLDELGTADVAISMVYIGVLGVVGVFILLDARTDGAVGGHGRSAAKVQAITLPPMISLSGGAIVSVWSILLIGLGIGVLSGSLGVGGGFLVLPVMIYGFGLPVAIAVGTSIIQITVSGGIGAFGYALSNAVNVPVVTALLVGSVLGARIGVGATGLVRDAVSKEYFAITLLSGSIAIGCNLLGTTFGVETLGTVSVVLIGGVVILVSGAIVRSSIETLKVRNDGGFSQYQ